MSGYFSNKVISMLAHFQFQQAAKKTRTNSKTRKTKYYSCEIETKSRGAVCSADLRVYDQRARSSPCARACEMNRCRPPHTIDIDPKLSALLTVNRLLPTVQTSSPISPSLCNITFRLLVCGNVGAVPFSVNVCALVVDDVVCVDFRKVVFKKVSSNRGCM